MGFALSLRSAPALPKLAWLAHLDFERRTLFVLHGSAVEHHKDWVVEGVWDGNFAEGDFHLSENFFGSGIRIKNGLVYFVPSSGLVDRLFYCLPHKKMLVSNSLPLLLAGTGGSLDLSHNYDPESTAISKGIRHYNPDFKVTHPQIEKFLQIYHHNIVVDQGGNISLEARTKVHDLSSFQDYYGRLQQILQRLRANYADPSRATPLAAFSAISSGYDSAAVSRLVSSLGVTTCFNSRRSNSAVPSWLPTNMALDDGTAIARKLSMEVIYLDRPSTDVCEDEVYFYAVGSVGAEPIFHSMAAYIIAHCQAAVVFTGYHGGEVWEAELEPKYLNSDLRESGVDGLLLSEMRLKAGFIHIPVPFILARSVVSLNRISRSPEMQPWRLGTSYDRPIPRRILEEAGVERQLFGMRKKAVMTHVVGFPRNPRLRKQFRQFLRDHCRVQTTYASFRNKFNRLGYYGCRASDYFLQLVRSRTFTLPPRFSYNLQTKWNVWQTESKLRNLLFIWAVGVLTQRIAPVVNDSPASCGVSNSCALPPTPRLGRYGLVYSLIGHRIGYSHSQEVSRCIHKRFP